jgi:hypothetical protein
MLGLCMRSLRSAVRDGPASLGFAIGLSLVVSVGVARAAPQIGDPEGRLVKDMVRDAVVLEKAGKCKEALGLLRQAEAIRETGEVLLYTGECQAQGGALLEAQKTWEHAEEVARNEKDKATRDLVSQRIVELRSRIPTVLLRLPKDVAAPTVKVDDQVQPADRSATPIALNPGDHTITVTADGRQPFTKKLTLVERDTSVVNVALPLVSEAAPAVDDHPADAAPQRGVPLISWVAGGAAVALGAGGVVSFAAAGSAAADGKTACAKMVTCSSSQIGKVHQLDDLALGLWIGAGASAAFGVTYWLVNRPKSSEPAPAPAVGLTLSLTGGSLHGSF